MALPTLVEPLRLLWLLLLPVIWWLCRPVRPRTAVVTAHLRQWLAARDALRRRPVRARPLRTWLLLAATALAILAHAEPRLPDRPGPRRLAVILDASASLLAGEGEAWRRTEAALRGGLATLPPEVELRLLRLGGEPQILHGEAVRRLTGLRPPAGTPGLALPALAAAVAGEADTAVWCLTDGQHGWPTAGALTAVGTPQANQAIVAVTVDDRWPLPPLSVRVTVQNFAGSACEVALGVTGAATRGDAQAPESLRLPPFATVEVTLGLTRTAAGGPLRIALTDATGGPHRDGLRADDAWTAVLPPLPEPRISVLAEAEAGPAARIAAATLAAELGGTVVGPDDQRAAFVLVEGGALPGGRLPGRGATFGTLLREGSPPEPATDPVVVDWDRQHPLLRGLDLSELRILRTWPGSLPAGRTLVQGQVDAAPAPLMVLAEAPGHATLHCAFRLQDSNLALLPAFPQLLRRSLLAAFGEAARWTEAEPGLPGAGEGDLTALGGAPDRPLPAFGGPGRSLAALALLLALLLLAVRAWLR